MCKSRINDRPDVNFQAGNIRIRRPWISVEIVALILGCAIGSVGLGVLGCRRFWSQRIRPAPRQTSKTQSNLDDPLNALLTNTAELIELRCFQSVASSVCCIPTPSFQRSETSSVATDYDELRNDVKESQNSSLEALQSANAPDARECRTCQDERGI